MTESQFTSRLTTAAAARATHARPGSPWSGPDSDPPAHTSRDLFQRPCQRLFQPLSWGLALGIGLGIGLGSAAGCASLPPPDLKAPEVSISDLSLDGIGFDTTRFSVMVEARNPNTEDIRLSDVRVDLSVVGVKLGQAELPTDRLLLGGQTQTRIPMHFSIPSSRLLEIGSSLRDGALLKPSYVLSGSARWGDSGYRFPIVKEGKIDLRERFGRLLNLFEGWGRPGPLSQ